MPYIQIPFYNITAPAALFVVSTRAKLKSYITVTAGSAGILTFNDCATLAARGLRSAQRSRHCIDRWRPLARALAVDRCQTARGCDNRDRR
jgi:hypothetical protein